MSNFPVKYQSQTSGEKFQYRWLNYKSRLFFVFPQCMHVKRSSHRVNNLEAAQYTTVMSPCLQLLEHIVKVRRISTGLWWDITLMITISTAHGDFPCENCVFRWIATKVAKILSVTYLISGIAVIQTWNQW